MKGYAKNEMYKKLISHKYPVQPELFNNQTQILMAKTLNTAISQNVKPVSANVSLKMYSHQLRAYDS